MNINCARDCYKKFFRTFNFRCIYDIKMTKGDFVNGKISEKKFEKIVRENGFIQNLTLKLYSSLSNIYIYVII